MKLLITKSKLVTIAILTVALTFGGNVSTAAAQSSVQQRHAHGTFAKPSTVCIGPLSPSADSPVVQIFGFTNASGALIWQVVAVSSQSAPVVVFETTARSVDETVPPNGNFLFEACVIKNARAPQDFDVTLELDADRVNKAPPKARVRQSSMSGYGWRVLSDIDWRNE